ncbi:MAG: outer membrane beta-barrel protein [Terrimonas sp.]|nr:outer membrane beta-barrel protein [Terrimonas sp.]
MKRIIFIFLTVLLSATAGAQNWQAEFGAGISGYSGDLTQKVIQIRSIGPSGFFNLKYQFHPQILFRTGISWGNIGANDKNNKDSLLKRRNLSFKSNVYEFNIGLEVNLIDPIEPFEVKTLPYIFGGFGLFHFDPYAFDNSGKKVFLKPLSTEGQGLREYPSRKPYKLTQLCIPFGAGVKMKISDKTESGFEILFRKTFTDYLDDVSTRYVDYNILKDQKGEKAVEMAFRSITPAGVPLEPVTDDIRGNPSKKDLYYTIGFKLTVKLGKQKKKSTTAETSTTQQ